MEGGNGEVFEILGDLVRVSKCEKIVNFTITWSRRWKGGCILEFPVNITGYNKTAFVDIQSRRLVMSPSNTPCDTLPKVIFLRNESGTYFEVNSEGLVRRTSMRFEVDQLVSEVKINRAQEWDEFETEEQVPTSSILQILQRARLSMIDITRMTKSKSLTSAIMGEVGEVFDIIGRGAGGVAADLGGFFGDVFGGIASGSVQIVKSLTGGARDIISDTTGVVTGGITHIILVANNVIQWIAISMLFAKLFGAQIRRSLLRNTANPMEEGFRMKRAPIPVG